MNTILYVLQISSSVALSPGVVPPRPPSLKTQQTHSREQQHPLVLQATSPGRLG